MAEKSASKQKSVIKAKTSGVQDESTQPEAGPSRLSRDEDSKLNEDVSSQHSEKEEEKEEQDHEGEGGENDDADEEEEGDSDNESTAEGFVKGMDPGSFIGDKSLKPLTPEGLAAFKAAQDRAGVIYISRIPPGMRPAKVRHLMSAYGAVGRVYLQQEDAKRAYLRKKFTSTKKVHYTEGWVEFKDKKVARSVAEMLNAQPIGGKKGTRWRDDIWTMKYLPRFKWYMLTEQVAYEAAVHTAKLRVELSQSKTEQQEYLKNVELARVLDKRAAKKKENGEEFEFKPNPQPKKRNREGEEGSPRKKKREEKPKEKVSLDSVLTNIF